MKFLKYFLSLTLILGPYAQAWDQAASKVVQVDQASGVSSTPNYWKSGDAELTLSGVAAYNDGAVDKPVDCTGGTPTITAARSSTAPMYDKQSWLITKPASNVQGQGVAFEFDVDNGIAAVEMMDLMFEYIVDSGTFAAGSDTTNSDLMVYIYDVTAGQLIEPFGGSKLYTSSTTLKGDYRGWFQSTLGSKKYRVCLHQATTSASAYTLKVDAGKVHKSKQVVGTIITDWQSYTPVLSAATGAVSNYTISGRQRRVGDTIELSGVITFSSTSSAFTAPIISLPSGLSVDTTKLSGSIVSPVGQVYIRDAGITNYFGAARFVNSISAIQLEYVTTNTSDAGSFSDPTLFSIITNTTPITFNTSDEIIYNVTLPITGWSAGARMSDGYDGRDLTAKYTGATATLTSSYSNVTFTTKVTDKTNSYSGSTFTAPSSKTYNFSGQIFIQGTAAVNNVTNIRIFKNGTTALDGLQYVYAGAVTQSVGIPFNFQGVELLAGETVVIQAASNITSPVISASASQNYLAITAESGTPFMSPTALWETHYAGTAGDAIGTTDSLIKFTTKVEDTFGSYDPLTGLWKAKGPATCSVGWAVTTASVNLSTSQRMIARLFKDNANYADGSISLGSGVATVKNSVGNLSSVKVITGTELKIMAASDVATTAGSSQTGNYFTVSCRQSGN